MWELVEKERDRAEREKQRRAQVIREDKAAAMPDTPSQRAVKRGRQRVLSYDETRRNKSSKQGERPDNVTEPRTEVKKGRHKRKQEQGVIPGGGVSGTREAARTRKDPKMGRVLGEWMRRGAEAATDDEERTWTSGWRTETRWGAGTEERSEERGVKRSREGIGEETREKEEINERGERYRRRKKEKK